MRDEVAKTDDINAPVERRSEPVHTKASVDMDLPD